MGLQKILLGLHSVLALICHKTCSFRLFPAFAIKYGVEWIFYGKCEKLFQFNIEVELWPFDDLKQELWQAISEWNSFFQQQTEGEKKLTI